VSTARLELIGRELGAETSLDAIAAEHVEYAADRAWGELGPATWNRNVAG
jgi:hypothetical protein